MSDKARIGPGRYRVVPTALWESTDFQRLSPNARLVLLALKSGSTSSFAGIGLVYSEALTRETGLTASEIEKALGELEKRPAPSSSWIVRGGPVIWVRHQLRSGPVVKKSGGKPNPDQQTGISRHVGALPRDNAAVIRFLRHYHEMLQDTKSRTTGKTKGGTVGATEGGSPAVAVAATSTNTNTPASAREPRPSDVTHVTGSNNRQSHDPATALNDQSQPPELCTNEAEQIRQYGRTLTLLERQGRHPLPTLLLAVADAPAGWFNDCRDGQQRQCVKTSRLQHVRDARQCDVHRLARVRTGT